MKKIFTQFSKQKAHILSLIVALTFGATQMFGQVATDGDYRSVANGNWTAPASWEVRASGTWSAASAAPTSSNNVYIQAGHTITVNAATVSCRDLHITKAKAAATAPVTPNAIVTAVLAFGVNTVEVSGKIRSYYPTDGVAPITGSADGTFYTQTNGGSPASAMITATAGTSTNTALGTGGGTLKFVGTSRAITASGEWGAAALSAVVVNFALTAGNTGTSAGFKAWHIVISSGTMTVSNFLVGVGVVNTGTFTIKNGATWISGANGSGVGNPALSAGNLSGANLRCSSATIESGATVEFNGGAPTLDATTFTNNGTIIYGFNGAQTFVNKSTDASSQTISAYTNLNCKSTGIKSLSAAVTVSGDFTLAASTKVSLGAFDMTIASGATITATFNSNTHIVTSAAGGTGKLTLSNLSTSTPTLFPLGFSTGVSTSTYEPFTIKPTNASVNVSANVSATLSGTVVDATKVSARQWDITPSAAPGATAMTFTPSVLPAAGVPSPPALGHYNTTTSAWEEQRTGVTYASGTLSVANYSGTFSPFGSGTAGAFSATVLGVELSKFDVKSTKNTALLSWSTASEKNNAVFNIEQSTNGVDFRNIGQVKGNGTTNAASNYNFEHLTPATGVNYYRLKQVDFDGTATLSAVRSVVFGKNGLIVKPTLAQDAINVVVSDEAATTINIINISGQIVLTAKAQGEQRIDVSTLPSGLYIVRNATGDVSRFVKQ